MLVGMYYQLHKASQLAQWVNILPAIQQTHWDEGSTPGSGRSSGWGHSNPIQYSCLENLRDRGAWWDTVHRVAKSRIQLKQLSTHWAKCIVFKKLTLKDKFPFIFFPSLLTLKLYIKTWNSKYWYQNHSNNQIYIQKRFSFSDINIYRNNETLEA